MRIYRSLGEISGPVSLGASSAATGGRPGLGQTVVSIGNFDGVHCGHRWILELIEARARALSAESSRPVTSVAVTFEPHPSRLLRPEDSPRLITPLETRLELLENTGVDAVLLLPFTHELSRMSGEEFVTAILREGLKAVEVHEGENFRFGHRAHCGTADLEALGRKLGFGVCIHPARSARGITISSSKARQCIQAGEMTAARILLGRPFSIRSTPAPGRGVGSKLTVPTINLAPYDELLPADGVYITRLRIGAGASDAKADPKTEIREDRVFDAVTNAGRRPTFGENAYAIETYLLDYAAAGATADGAPLVLTAETLLELTFLHRLRSEQKFASPEALKAQIYRDVTRARRYFHLWKVTSR
ncbi:MAG TPA: bifunctional riboflavin kinase/FMN adenylyltransferase [Acidisarcina sp.]